MRTPLRLQARALPRLSPRILVLTTLAALSVGAVLLANSPADAASGLCEQGQCRDQQREQALDRRGLEQQSARALADISRENGIRSGTLSDQEFFSFSGVGALVCSVNGQPRTATAFLVGAFDIGVTVAHTFVDNGVWTEPQDCVYTTTDSLGQIRERLPVSYIKAQWAEDASSFGQPAKDLAVIRLTEPSRFAQRTMPLGKFSGSAASVLMVGFKTDLASNTAKLKAQGHVYDRKTTTLGMPNVAGFTHDMDASGIAEGAPVIDERSGIIIGVHTQSRTTDSLPRNTMIAMNEWLETTLKAELKIQAAARVTN